MAAPERPVGGVPSSKPDRRAPRRRSEAGGRLANAVLAHLPLATAVIGADLRLSFWNHHAAGLFGVPPLLAADAPPLADTLAGIAGLAPQQRDRIVAFVATHIAAGDRAEPEGWLRISLGRDRRITLRVQGIGSHRWMLVIDDGMMAAYGRNGAGQGGDAWLDSLTGLSNRRHFNQILRTLVDGATPGSRHALLMIDLDRFKSINDTLGHPIGDALLCLAAQRLRRETREEDLLVRSGGDEFLILLAGGETAEALAARVIDILSRPFLVEGRTADLGASVGIVRFPEHGASADDLMRHADLALHEAKSAGGRAWRVFDPSLASATKARMVRGIDLREAVFLGRRPAAPTSIAPDNVSTPG